MNPSAHNPAGKKNTPATARRNPMNTITMEITTTTKKRRATGTAPGRSAAVKRVK
jgi:hypothetical protein